MKLIEFKLLAGPGKVYINVAHISALTAGRTENSCSILLNNGVAYHVNRPLDFVFGDLLTAI